MARTLAAALLALSVSGCTYLRDRAYDFADLWRIEGGAGVGIQAGVGVGELLHLGLGSSTRTVAGFQYGIGTTGERRVEDHFPLSYARSLVESDKENLHSLRIGHGENARTHRCFAIFPGEIHTGQIERPPMHYWNLEAGVMAGLVGIDLGFNVAELGDFLLGIFGVDFARDDETGNRPGRALWVAPEEHPIRSP